METDNPFEKVLDRLREKGWNQGNYGPTAGPNCILGAFMYELSLRECELWGDECIEGLETVLLEQYWERTVKGDMTHVPNFNDHPDTTFADVEKVLEKAAVKWEEERVMRDG